MRSASLGAARSDARSAAAVALARDVLVRRVLRVQLLRERLLQRPEELLEVGAPELEAERLADRDDVRVARLVEHQRHLAKVVAAAERDELLLAAVELVVRALDRARLDEEEVLARVALARQVLPDIVDGAVRGGVATLVVALHLRRVGRHLVVLGAV